MSQEGFFFVVPWPWYSTDYFLTLQKLTSQREVPADEAYEQKRLRFAEITDEI